MKNQNIIIKDPLYKQILLSYKYKKIIDKKEFQRLRFIKQTSFVDMVYPSANHTRFSHSLGAYHLMKKVLANKLLETDTKTKDNLKIAALLHDIGHGPFSHLWEKVFPHFDHEKATQEIIRKMGFNASADILLKKSEFSQLITSTIDVDKLDYMARDSYFAGVSYGVAEVDFILQHITIKNGKLTIIPSSVSSVEDLITQRVNLFKTVYFHKMAVEYDFIFIKIFQRVKDLLKNKKEIEINDSLKAFFTKTNTLEDLNNLTDYIILSHIHNWKNHDDKILSTLCENFLSRNKFKVINLSHNLADPQKIKEKVAKKYDINYFYGHICYPIKIIQTPIYVNIDSKLKKMEDISELISFYKKQKFQCEFIIYPRDIDNESN